MERAPLYHSAIEHAEHGVGRPVPTSPPIAAVVRQEDSEAPIRLSAADHLSHDSYYASAALSVVVGQVQNYIEKLDRCRDSIKANDGEDTCKVRAKIIIGRNGDQKQVEALRRFNGHMHRIEVLTFDQLLRIAENVVSYLGNALAPSPQATTPTAPAVAAPPPRPSPTRASPTPAGPPQRSPPLRPPARPPVAPPARTEPVFLDDDIPF